MRRDDTDISQRQLPLSIRTTKTSGHVDSGTSCTAVHTGTIAEATAGTDNPGEMHACDVSRRVYIYIVGDTTLAVLCSMDAWMSSVTVQSPTP